MLRFAAAAALLVPAALHVYTQSRIAGAEQSLGRLLGAEVHVGDAEVRLGGELVLSDVTVGDVLEASSVEAAIGLESLLRGSMIADEIIVSRPRLRVDATALRLLGRLPGRGAGPGAGGAGGASRRLKRIVMHDGEVTIDLGEHGRVRAREIALSPQEGGVRVVLGPSQALVRWGKMEATAGFARAGLDVELPSGRLGRAAFDGGKVTVGAAGGPALVLEDVIVVRGQATRLEGAIAGGGRLAVTIGPGSAAAVETEHLPLAPLEPLLPPWLAPSGEISGRVHVSLEGEVVRATSTLSARGLAIDHPVLARTPVPIDGRIDGRVSWDRSARRGDGDLRFVTGALTVSAEGALALDDSGTVTGGRLHASMPPLSCGAALLALPDPLRGPLSGLDLGGSIAADAVVAFDAAHPDDTRLDLDLDVGCTVVRDDSAAAVDLVAGPYVHRLPDGGTRILAPSDPDYVALAALPDFVPAAFVAAEDARFFQHRGFDPVELRRSFAADMSAGKIERGGSTISQQLVKNLYLGRERTLARKLTEAILTWRLEGRLAKTRILEAYLNVIELGAGVYGIGPAAARWFGKRAAELTPAEAAYLAATTAAPTTAETTLRISGRPDAEVLRRAQVVLGALRIRIGAEAYQRAVHDLAMLRPAAG